MKQIKVEFIYIEINRYILIYSSLATDSPRRSVPWQTDQGIVYICMYINIYMYIYMRGRARPQRQTWLTPLRNH